MGAKDFLMMSIDELAASIDAGDPGSRDWEAKKIILNHKLHQRSIRMTWAVAGISAFVSLVVTGSTLFLTWKQFKIENRPYVGLEGFQEVSMGDNGSTLSIFRESIKNYGKLPAYFKLEIPGKPLVCVNSPINQLMPGQAIQLNCERSIGEEVAGAKTICDIVLAEEIHILYGRTPDNYEFQTILKMRTDSVPTSPGLKEKLRMWISSGCDGAGPTNIQWYVAAAT